MTIQPRRASSPSSSLFFFPLILVLARTAVQRRRKEEEEDENGGKKTGSEVDPSVSKAASESNLGEKSLSQHEGGAVKTQVQ